MHVFYWADGAYSNPSDAAAGVQLDLREGKGRERKEG